MLRIFIVVVFALLVSGTAAAQRDMNAEVITIQGVDGFTLVGEFYAAEDEENATVMLMHMLSGRRADWAPLIPALTDSGYNVLAVDLRGHGESVGNQDWAAAERDIESWLDWLSDQPSVDETRIALVGASIGANLALVGCAYDARCITVVALSPGLDYRGVVTEDAIAEGLTDRSALLVASVADAYSTESVKALGTLAAGELGIQLYRGRLHGTQLFSVPDAPVVTLIMNWLAAYV